MNRDNEYSLNPMLQDDLMLSHFTFHFPFLVRLKGINQNHITRQPDFLDTRHDSGKASAAINLTVAGRSADASAVD
jgi:hypothetical protein